MKKPPQSATRCYELLPERGTALSHPRLGTQAISTSPDPKSSHIHRIRPNARVKLLSGAGGAEP
jgi:hypothetical protein